MSRSIKIMNWTGTFHPLIEGCQAKDTYNRDETGLFYRALPTKSFPKRGSKKKLKVYF